MVTTRSQAKRAEESRRRAQRSEEAKADCVRLSREVAKVAPRTKSCKHDYSSAAEELPRFSYENGLGRDYNQDKCINSVEFAVGRHYLCFQTIEFTSAVGEEAAVGAVEKFLSKPMTKERYNALLEAGDLLGGGDPWREARKYVTIRGDALGSCTFIEVIVIEEGHMSFACAS